VSIEKLVCVLLHITGEKEIESLQTHNLLLATITHWKM